MLRVLCLCWCVVHLVSCVFRVCCVYWLCCCIVCEHRAFVAYINYLYSVYSMYLACIASSLCAIYLVYHVYDLFGVNLGYAVAFCVNMLRSLRI